MTEPEDPAAALDRVFRSVLGLSTDTDPRSLRQKGHSGWDSMAQINLILAVEQEFRIQISPEDAAAATSFEKFLALINARP